MDNKIKLSKENELKLIASLVLEGMSNTEISDKLGYSRSSVAYKINNLFKNFGAKNRINFIINVLGKIIEKKKNDIYTLENTKQNLTNENQQLKYIIGNILKYQNKKNNLKYWLQEASKHK